MDIVSCKESEPPVFVILLDSERVAERVRELLPEMVRDPVLPFERVRGDTLIDLESVRSPERDGENEFVFVEEKDADGDCTTVCEPVWVDEVEGDTDDDLDIDRRGVLESENDPFERVWEISSEFVPDTEVDNVRDFDEDPSRVVD